MADRRQKDVLGDSLADDRAPAESIEPRARARHRTRTRDPRRGGQREWFGLTSPLITTAGGSKMGKTAQGAVWLNSDKSSCWDYWQHWSYLRYKIT